MLEILDGVDYSNFPAKLKEYYRSEHLKTIRPSNALDWHQKRLEELTGQDLARHILDNHGDLAFHEAERKDGSFKHLKRCEEQYCKFKKSKRFKSYVSII